MKLKLLFVVAAAIFFTSCNQNADNPISDIDVAHTFIKATLENDYTTAETYLLKDETNRQYLEVWEKQFVKLSKEELNTYKNADIIVNEVSNVNDSITIVNYSNSYKKEVKTKVKMVKISGKWLVDFKYTFSGNM